MKHIINAAHDANEDLKKTFKHMEHYTDQVAIKHEHKGQPLDANNAWGKTPEQTTKILGKVKTL